MRCPVRLRLTGCGSCSWFGMTGQTTPNPSLASWPRLPGRCGESIGMGKSLQAGSRRHPLRNPESLSVLRHVGFMPRWSRALLLARRGRVTIFVRRFCSRSLRRQARAVRNCARERDSMPLISERGIASHLRGTFDHALGAFVGMDSSDTVIDFMSHFVCISSFSAAGRRRRRTEARA